MHIERDEGIVFNLKRISRIKKKFGLITEKRKKSKIRAGIEKYIEHNTVPNYLNQNFTAETARSCLSTDITYLTNKLGYRAYLSGVKDIKTREIIGYAISDRNDLNLVINSLDVALKNNISGAIIHSDQGYQYTSMIYQNYLKNNGLRQSMSRRGNCLDNAPIESFFGHLKDECEYKDWKTISDLRNKISKYIKYYNERRPQWTLKRKTPVEYRSFLDYKESSF